jgi:uncharacterized membrane protein YdbT with pleckstrin-like domain
MSSYLDREIQSDERIIYAAELHWIVYHFGMTITLAGALLGNYGDQIVRLVSGDAIATFVAKPITYIALAIIAVGAMHLFFGFIRQISTELVITNRRVIAKHGFISTTTFEVMIDRVEGANIDQTVLGRILGYGTVMVKGTGGGISPIDHVANPYLFHSYLMRTMEEAQKPGVAAAAHMGNALVMDDQGGK